jgi:hypothetical protein
MKSKCTIASITLCVMSMGSFAQLPLVYTVENTGASCPAPPLPALSQLPVIEPLTDPFVRSNGSSRSTNFNDWACRRNEIKQEIEYYEIGTKPPRPDNITASYSGSVLTVQVTRNGQSMTLTAQVVLPTGAGPFPAVIGMNSGTGSLPATIFSSRNIARITYSHDQVTTYNNPQLTNPFYRLYPEYNLNNSGQYSAWAWGVSRIIDGLELVQSGLPVNLRRIAVTGCSYAGKMALFAGAFDERVALTIAQESGGGGAPAWRVSETLGDVERLGSTSNQWFRNEMFQFAGANVPKLPHDHHELMAMVAPRALLVTGNTDYMWLANPSCYVSARATKEVYNTFGIGDRFGFYIDGGHGHCAIPNGQVPAISAFVDKFLLGNTSVNTNDISVNPYPSVDYQRWYSWWGTGNPTFPNTPATGKWLEAECGTVGSNWNNVADAAASGGRYVTVQTGLNSTASAPAGAAATIALPFTIETGGTHNIFARINCSNADNDSYWVKIDNGSFVMVNNLVTSGWQWKQLTSANLGTGSHTLTIAYREDGAHLDKIAITTSTTVPSGTGSAATNCSQAAAATQRISTTTTQNIADDKISVYPNPVTYNININLGNNNNNITRIQVLDIAGRVVRDIAVQNAITSILTEGFSAGTYLVRMQGNMIIHRKIVVQ